MMEMKGTVMEIIRAEGLSDGRLYSCYYIKTWSDGSKHYIFALVPGSLQWKELPARDQGERQPVEPPKG
jgi:hypothetical protein